MRTYSRQHQMLERLHEIKVNYIGHFDSRESRKYTIKETNKTGGMYLYSWEYFKKDDQMKFSKEKGEWIQRQIVDKTTGAPREGSYCHYVYIGKFSQFKDTYFKYADEKIIERIDILAGRLEKQIDLMDRRIRKQEAIANREMTEAELFQIEKDIEADFGDNLERFEQIIEMIQEDKDKRETMLNTFLAEEELRPKFTLKELRNKSRRTHGKTKAILSP